MAEIFQCSVSFRAACGKQGVFFTSFFFFAFGVGILKFIIGACFYTGTNVHRLVDQPRNAEQRRTRRRRAVFGCAQQGGVAHGVQRQDEAALAVVQREVVHGGGIFPVALCRVVLVHVDGGILVRACNFTPFNFELIERHVAICFIKHNVVDRVQVVVLAVAAPV